MEEIKKELDDKQEIKRLTKALSNQKKRLHKVISKLRVKTSALWFSAGVIADNNLMPNKTQEEIYEILKIMGFQISEENRKKEKSNDRKES